MTEKNPPFFTVPVKDRFRGIQLLEVHSQELLAKFVLVMLLPVAQLLLVELLSQFLFDRFLRINTISHSIGIELVQMWVGGKVYS